MGLFRGNAFFRARLDQEGLGKFKAVASFLPILNKARDICRIAGISPVLNERIDGEQARDIDHLHKLLTKGEVRQKVPGAKIALWFPRSGIRELLKKPRMVDDSLVISNGIDEKMHLFDHEVEVGKLERDFSHVRLESTKKELQDRLAGTKGNIKVEFSCTEHSEVIVRKAKR